MLSNLQQWEENISFENNGLFLQWILLLYRGKSV